MAHYQARHHPVATFIVVLTLSPYIAAALLLYVIAFVLAAAFDAVGRR